MGLEKWDFGGIEAGKAEPTTEFPGYKEGPGKMGFSGSKGLEKWDFQDQGEKWSPRPNSQVLGKMRFSGSRQ